jgi:hypothetical protein
MSQVIKQYLNTSGLMSAGGTPIVQNKTVDIFTAPFSGFDPIYYNDDGPNASFVPKAPSIGNQYFKYSCTHMIVEAYAVNADDSGAKLITGIDAYFANALGNNSPSTSAKNIEIWCAHTTESIASDFVKTDMSQSQSTFDFTDRIKVVNKGSLPYSTVGWDTIDFDTNFVYDGTSNLVFSFYNAGVTSFTTGRTTFAYAEQIEQWSMTYASDLGSNPVTNSYSMDALDSVYQPPYLNILLKINY